ncbi:MAG: HoxN/HupN/NixA family nickel/cobalt transporter [Candidatus Acididesulfobacter diazotrophicus]|jgi:high-affinity nickel-transport protein|uniref:Nickel/cobalt efflux system n=1 Tax=Candidatus Acididesulfobacter diazotrophicus TaxID=2597226 RepID=A0A519BLY7_9DELT|nr:MAG: HoxN/HupN/NixA family nickel/cobalt transporter [Candidatus Acididesulfobacter diazotrophicus]
MRNLKTKITFLYLFLFSFLAISLFILFARLHANPAFMSLGFLAMVLGAKHGLDADHIAAIDNTTRKFMNEGKKPVTIGMFFSLGHSTSVFFLIGIMTLTASYLDKFLPDSVKNLASVLGTGVSAAFLYIIAILNIVILISIIKLAKNYKTNREIMEQELQKRGFMNRYFYKIFNLVRHSYQMYFVGLLFGIGFDTGTEAAVLAIAGGLAASGHPFIDIMILPLLFSATMMIVDSTDGVLMVFAYSWAFLNPVRKIFYNITITTLSIMLALGIGTLEWIQVIAMELGLNNGIFYTLQTVSFYKLGSIIVGLFIAVWIASIIIYKSLKIEEKYDPDNL